MICRYILSSVLLHALVFLLVSTRDGKHSNGDKEENKELKAAEDRVEAIKTAIEEKGKADKKAKEEKGKIVPKSVEVEIVETPPAPPQPKEPEPQKEEEPIVKKAPPPKKEHKNPRKDVARQEEPRQGVQECNRWYGGIGVTIDARTLTVQEVTIGYPAYRAGIRVGDVMENGADELQGEPGTAVTVAIYRRSIQKEFILTITREKICVE